MCWTTQHVVFHVLTSARLTLVFLTHSSLCPDFPTRSFIFLSKEVKNKETEPSQWVGRSALKLHFRAFYRTASFSLPWAVPSISFSLPASAHPLHSQGVLHGLSLPKKMSPVKLQSLSSYHFFVLSAQSLNLPFRVCFFVVFVWLFVYLFDWEALLEKITQIISSRILIFNIPNYC